MKFLKKENKFLQRNLNLYFLSKKYFNEIFKFQNKFYKKDLLEEQYKITIDKLFQVNKFVPKKVNLNNISRACDLIGNPEKNIKYVHVTGTNGKGSICKKLSKFFEISGFKTGLYTSPHISSFRERIQINSNFIEKEFIVEICEFMFELNKKYSLDLTYFEYVTLMCFIYFNEKNIDIGIIEVGLGGNLDSTNIINPLLSIITSIGLDHLDTLGYTQNEIAKMKAGIIKDGVPVIIGQDCFPREVFIKESVSKNSKLYILTSENINSLKLKDYEKKFINIVKPDFKDIKLFSNFKENIMDFDLENKIISNFAIDLIRKENILNLLFENDNIEQKLEAVNSKQNCRIEDVFKILGKKKVEIKVNRAINDFFSKVDLEKTKLIQQIFKINLVNNKRIHKIYLDVGHNSHGIEKLLMSLRMNYPSCFIRTIVGFSFGKDQKESIKNLTTFSDKLYFCSAKSSRALNYNEMINMVMDNRKNISVGDSIFSNLDDMNGFIEIIKEETKKLNFSDEQIQYFIQGIIIIKLEISIELSKNSHSFQFNLLKALWDIENKNEIIHPKKEIIVICGSFFHMEEIREMLGYEDERDYIEMNELNSKLKFG